MSIWTAGEERRRGEEPRQRPGEESERQEDEEEVERQGFLINVQRIIYGYKKILTAFVVLLIIFLEVVSILERRNMVSPNSTLSEASETVEDIVEIWHNLHDLSRAQTIAFLSSNETMRDDVF